jgi:lipopolysaccharide transport system permease protein
MTPSTLEPRADSGVLVIEPPRGISVPVRELWEYRELAWFLLLRAIKPRYRQTVLGIGWAVLPPLMMMVVFSIFLNRVAGVPSQAGVPYPVFAYAGLLIWQYFSGATGRGAGSLLAGANFLTKVYFPRLLIPISTVLAALFDLAIAFVVLIPLMAAYGVYPNWRLAALPLFILLATVLAVAVTLTLAAASVQYRDLGLGVPLALQLWLFATPVVYPASIFPGDWQTVVSIANPMAPIVDGFRWSVLGLGPAPGWQLGAAIGVMLTLLAIGLAFFQRMERTYADEI